MKDKRLIIILAIMILTIVATLISIPSHGQSFYHKKMKKVKYPEIKNCAAMRPAKTMKDRRKTAKLYAKKRNKLFRKREEIKIYSRK